MGQAWLSRLQVSESTGGVGVEEDGEEGEEGEEGGEHSE